MLATVASFLDPPTAEVARGRLASEGVDADIHDAFFVGLHWLASNAVHGVKLRVAEPAREEAMTILRQDYSDLLEPLEPSDLLEACERCGPDHVVSYSPLRVVAALTLFPAWPVAFLVGVPFIKWRARQRCLTASVHGDRRMRESRRRASASTGRAARAGEAENREASTKPRSSTVVGNREGPSRECAPLTRLV